MPILPQNFVPMMPILDSLREGILVVDASGTVVAINRILRQFYQGGETPFPGYPLSDFNAADWVEVKRVLSSGQPLLGMTMTLPSASVLVNRTPLLLGGKIAGVVCSMQDIRGLEVAIRQLDAYKELDTSLDDILELCPQSLLIADRLGIIIRANHSFATLNGVERDTLIGRSIHDLYPDAMNVKELVLACLKYGEPQRAQRAAQGARQYMLEASPVLGERGAVRLVAASVVPIAKQDFIQKHFDEQESDSGACRENKDGEQAILAVTKDFGIVARSKTMLRVIQRAAKVSQSESSVLLQGESGVGKSMLAALIHKLSPRCAEVFVPINCGAIPEQLMESELFGYERGAFTGASPKGKTGLIESGNGGTVFFDEIGELSLPMQVKLLEAIDKKAFLRVGGTRHVKVDFRIIAATNRDLEQEVAEGRFRKDLFYRINVIPLTIPPLRERKEDIGALAVNMLARHNAENATSKRLSPEVVELLMLHDFPGNARELGNAMEWMLVMGEGNVIYPRDMPMAFRLPGAAALPEAKEQESSSPEHLEYFSEIGNRPLKDVLFDFEAHCLKRALDTYGNMQDVAKALGMHPTTLWRKLTQHKLLGYGKQE